jgi:hypothetical protein
MCSLWNLNFSKEMDEWYTLVILNKVNMKIGSVFSWDYEKTVWTSWNLLDKSDW